MIDVGDDTKITDSFLRNGHKTGTFRARRAATYALILSFGGKIRKMPTFDEAEMETLPNGNQNPLSDATNSEERRAHILVVDDEPELLKTLQVNLAKAGYQVTTATNGEEALDVLQHAKFDVLFTDVVMPVMGGFELLSKVCNDASLDDLAVIITSAKPTTPDTENWTEILRESTKRQRIWHLVKPHNMYEAICAIDAALQRDGQPGWKQWLRNRSRARE